MRSAACVVSHSCSRVLDALWVYNETLEGMYSGVPKLKFPLVWDQFLNAKMIVEERRGQGTDEKVY